MKKSLFIVSLFAFLIVSINALAQQDPPEVTLTEISHGIYSSQVIAKEKMDESPSGDHRVVARQVLVKKTEKIPAKLGAEFGAEYKLKSTGKDSVNIEIEWIFPHAIVDPAKNASYESIRYALTLGPADVNASTYSLDNDFEVVKGTWLLNVYYDNKIIYSQKFELK
ncbi:MAG: DUF3859 domain-containing protein [Bacteroidetes bacterium]|nr:DUF3859 domain-containing protein [Bacteroidota bacterium]